jgi:DNA-binding PadR family transcriptional regulator
MEAVSTLGYALLGLLARGPLSGYDLAQRLGERMQFFWGAGHSQIYPELRRLERSGLITHKRVAQTDRPDKKVQRITAKGKKSLAAWVTSPYEPPPVKDELMLRMYSVWLADPARAAERLRAEERRHRERLAEYRTFEAQIREHWKAELDDASSPRFATWATLRRGLEYEKGYAEWLAWLAGLLEKSPGA